MSLWFQKKIQTLPRKGDITNVIPVVKPPFGTPLNYRPHPFHRRDDGYDYSEDVNPVVRRDFDVLEFLPVAGAEDHIILVPDDASDH